MGGVIAEILQGCTGRHREMSAFFLRAVQGDVVGKDLDSNTYNAVLNL